MFPWWPKPPPPPPHTRQQFPSFFWVPQIHENTVDQRLRKAWNLKIALCFKGTSSLRAWFMPWNSSHHSRKGTKRCSHCWWFRNPANQLRLVVFPIFPRLYMYIYILYINKYIYIFPRWLFGISEPSTVWMTTFLKVQFCCTICCLSRWCSMMMRLSLRQVKGKLWHHGLKAWNLPYIP